MEIGTNLAYHEPVINKRLNSQLRIMDSDRSLTDLDYTFTSKDINKILERSAKKSILDDFKDLDSIDKIKEKREKISNIDFDYEEDGTYRKLLNLARENEIEKEYLDGTVESYLSLDYDLQDRVKENFRSACLGACGGFLIGLMEKYAFGSHMWSPPVFGAAFTGIKDFNEYYLGNKSINEILRDDPGSILGYGLGYYFSSLA